MFKRNVYTIGKLKRPHIIYKKQYKKKKENTII